MKRTKYKHPLAGTRYKFRHAFDDPPANPRTPLRDLVYARARSLQSDLDYWDNNPVRWVGQTLRRAREDNAWLMFPPEDPAITPLRYLEIISGHPAAVILGALKVLGPTNFKPMYGWLEEPQAGDREYWLAKRDELIASGELEPTVGTGTTTNTRTARDRL